MPVDVCKHSYSDAIENKKILILGPVPPPYGGVSIHIKRVMYKLKQQQNKVEQFNTIVEYRYRWLPFYLLKLGFVLCTNQFDIIQYHTMCLSNSLPELYLIKWFVNWYKSELILVEHNCRHLYTRNIAWLKKYQNILTSVKKLVCIGNRTYASYYDTVQSVPCLITCEAAFLPPNQTIKENVLTGYSQGIIRFLGQHSPVLLATTSQPPQLQNDLYGFDICLEVIVQLKKEFPNIGLLYIVSYPLTVEQYVLITKALIDVKIVNNLQISLSNAEFWPLLKKVDLFLRPTRSDGASVSVAESCYFGTTTIASDVCTRPDGVHLFKTGDAKDCVRVVRRVLDMSRRKRGK